MSDTFPLTTGMDGHRKEVIGQVYILFNLHEMIFDIVVFMHLGSTHQYDI